MGPDTRSLTATPRNFDHVNLSQLSQSWGQKFHRHQVLCNNSSPQNCIIGDSHFERLSRTCFSHLYQENFPGWLNLGIGGDRIENIAWRTQHGGLPTSPAKVILCGGTNNFRWQPNVKQSIIIANTINDLAWDLIEKYKNIKLAVVGILPRKEHNKCEQADTINNILKHQLPSQVTFIKPPDSLYGGEGNYNAEFYQDDVHLNTKGYHELLHSPPFHPFLRPKLATQLETRNHVLNHDFAIGEAEFLGSG